MAVTPSTRKGRQSRQRIVAAAADLIYEHGVGGTTLDAVCAASGASRSQLYHYFDDKSDLVRAVIAHRVEVLLGSQADVLASLDTIDGLRRWRNLMVDLQRQSDCRGGCPIGSLAAELADHDEAARLDLHQAFQRWQAHISNGLRAMRDRGELDDTDVDELALATMASLEGGLILARTAQSTRPLEVALDAAIAHITHHLMVNNSATPPPNIH